MTTHRLPISVKKKKRANYVKTYIIKFRVIANAFVFHINRCNIACLHYTTEFIKLNNPYTLPLFAQLEIMHIYEKKCMSQFISYVLNHTKFNLTVYILS